MRCAGMLPAGPDLSGLPVAATPGTAAAGYDRKWHPGHPGQGRCNWAAPPAAFGQGPGQHAAPAPSVE